MLATIASGLLLLAPALLAAPTPVDEDAPWPRVRSTNGHTVTMHLPQVEQWTSNSFTARAAVEVKPAKAKTELIGVVWFVARGNVDWSNRLVTLDKLEITKGRFPTAPDNGSNALAIVREVMPGGARTVSLDYLITALGFVQAAVRRGAGGLKHDPPQILWSTNRAVLIVIDGEPILRAVTNTSLERVVNTPALLVRDKPSARFYLYGAGQWFAAAVVKGPWGPAQTPPPEVAALAPSTNQPAAKSDQPPPRIIVSTKPAELLMTSGSPDYRRVSGTGLQYIADSDSMAFFHEPSREVYLLLSGRWFKSKSLHGPWNYVGGNDLPSDFAKIPPNTPQGMVLSSVPNTPQAELAVLSTSVPTTATVNRREATTQVTYDGEPKFKPIEGTRLSYAVNAQLPVIQAGEKYFAVDNGVWFTASSPKGPWQVAAEVPDEIYSIPPSSPVYYATFVRVYQANEDEVETGYTSGYLGGYEDDGTVVYGTGWDYEYWYEDDYYGWGSTWGYNYVYVPWYQWWLWRPWWNEPGGLRAAIVDNIYDRWQGRPGVIHHDRGQGGAARGQGQPWAPFTGFPAQYGRFKGASRPAELAPPASTLALNAYTRPQTPVRPGEIPRGAQLLTTIKSAPGQGRDIYASPDGNVYLRKNDGWYRREGGDWNFYAPTRGNIERNRAAGVGVAQQPGGGGGNVYQPAANRGAAQGNVQGRGGRVPDTGQQARAQEVANLERAYYARSLGEMRSSNARAARPSRGGGRRR